GPVRRLEGGKRYHDHELPPGPRPPHLPPPHTKSELAQQTHRLIRCPRRTQHVAHHRGISTKTSKWWYLLRCSSSGQQSRSGWATRSPQPPRHGVITSEEVSDGSHDPR